MYITLFIIPALLSLLWILILNESSQLSLKKRTAALTHYKSFGTVNFRKQTLSVSCKCPYLSKYAGFSWPVSLIWLCLLFSGLMHWNEMLFWRRRQTLSRKWMAAVKKNKRKADKSSRTVLHKHRWWWHIKKETSEVVGGVFVFSNSKAQPSKNN